MSSISALERSVYALPIIGGAFVRMRLVGFVTPMRAKKGAVRPLLSIESKIYEYEKRLSGIECV